MKKGLIITISSIIAVVFAGGITFAQESGCSLDQEKFAELKAVQNNFQIDYLLRIREELRVRKALLNDTVGCAMKELSGLKSEFDGIKTDNGEVASLQAQFSPWFADTLNYYAIQKSQIGDLGLQGSKDFAKNFLLWRDGNFKSPAKIISNFITWSKNQDLLQIAQSRLKQIKTAIDVFGLNLNEEIRNGISGTGSEFQKAAALNQRAKEILRTYGSPDEALQAIRSSLESLSITYKNISSLVDKINKEIVK